jgi:hypothetical protein
MAHYLRALAATGRYASACEAAGIKKPTVAAWRRINLDNFAQREEEALQLSCEALEDLAVDRANSHSDTMLMYLLNNRSPRYNHPHARNGHGGMPVDPQEVVREMRRVWESMGDYCPPAEPVTVEVTPESSDGSE